MRVGWERRVGRMCLKVGGGGGRDWYGIGKQQNMSVIKAKLVLSREQGACSRQDLSLSRTDQQDCSSCSAKVANEVRQLVSIFREFVEISKKPAAAEPREGREEVEPRDRAVVVGLPAGSGRLGRAALEEYVTALCGQVWSRAFYYYSTSQLSFENAKIFSSQQILQNLARLREHYPLSAVDFAVIDAHLQGRLLEYMLNKYPMAPSQQANRNLNSALREFDDSDNLAHNYLHNSHVLFRYRDSGEYNDLIMRTLNEAVTRIEAPTDGGQTLFQRFEDKMTALFQQVADYEWMHKQGEGEGVQSEEELGMAWLSVTLNNNTALQKKVTLDENTIKTEYLKIKEKEKSTYEEKVKQYTHYKINKKLPESTRLFTAEEIASHRLKIDSPQVLRILTKWCTELERKFESTAFLEHFIEAASLEKSAFLSAMMGEVREGVGELIREEKARIGQELAELAANNFYMQSELLARKLAGAEFSAIDRHERISAQFSIDIVNNLHAYIIAYLNRLIHGLLWVFERFQQLPAAHQLRLPQGASFVTFQVMDLVRCKCSSREKEILRIYHELMRRCEENNSMTLVRVVNRLRRGTNDILINVKYHDVLCEIQLAIANNDNSFLEYSNTFNHYLYELKRSVFGPLTELSGIWKSLDSRFNTYRALDHPPTGPNDAHQPSNEAASTPPLAHGTLPLTHDTPPLAHDTPPVEKHTALEAAHKCSREGFLMPYSRPFICSLCSQHYFHNKFVKKHVKCRECEFWMCARCQIGRSDCLDLLAAAYQNPEVVRHCRKLGEGRPLPAYGMCIYVESQEIVIEPFRRYSSEKSVQKVMGVKNRSIYQIYDTSSDKQRSKFRAKFLIFEMDEDFASRHIKITNDAVKQYLTEEKFKHILARNKDTLNLNNERLTSHELQRLCATANKEQKDRIKNLELIGNAITTCDALAEHFPNAVRLDLSKNRVGDFKKLLRMAKLQKASFNDNDLKEFPLQICELPALKEVSLSDNAIKAIPSALRNCTHLASLHLTSNHLTELPSFLFEMDELGELSATSNFIREIPASIQLARRLHHLSIQNNYIQAIPREIEFLEELERLNLSYNKIAEVPALARLAKLKHINLRHNYIASVDTLLAAPPLLLRELDLSYNSITQAAAIDNFRMLKFLNLSHNELTTFPHFGPACSNLKHLLISSNKLAKMDTLENLLSLEEIELSDNLFEELHPSLGKLDNLAVLRVESNRLKGFGIAHMDSMVKLFLKRNKVGELRGLQMKNLEELDASENELAVFELNFLPKLKKINLNINQLQTLELSACLKISVVQAARNQLKAVPTFHSNNQLKFLNLEHNCIEEIPRRMMKSSCINTLNLSNNKIKVIPRELQNLCAIKNKSLFLQKNPLEVVECLNFITNKCGYDITSDIKSPLQPKQQSPLQPKQQSPLQPLRQQTPLQPLRQQTPLAPLQLHPTHPGALASPQQPESISPERGETITQDNAQSSLLESQTHLLQL